MQLPHPPRRRARSSAAHALALAALLVAGLLSGAPVSASAAPVDVVTTPLTQGDGSEGDPIRFDIAVDCASGRTGVTVVELEDDATIDAWYQLTVTLKDDAADDCFSQHPRVELCSEGSIGCTVTEYKTGFGGAPGTPWSHQVKFQFKLSAMWEPGDPDPSGGIQVVFGSFGNETGSVTFIVTKAQGGGGGGGGSMLPPGASTATVPATPAAINVSWAVLGGNGSVGTPRFYLIEVDDCSKVPTGVSIPPVVLNTATSAGDLGTWFTLDVTCLAGGGGSTSIGFDDGVLATPAVKSGGGSIPAGQMTFRLLPAAMVPDGVQFGGGFEIRAAAPPINPLPILVEAVAGAVVPSSGGGSGGAPAGPNVAAVAIATEQAAAAGVPGTSAAVLTRGGETVLLSSTLAPGTGPRGGLVIEAEGLRVTLASALGVRPDTGLIVPQTGEVQCTLCAALVPGSVVEVWVNSDPRLTAAVAVPADAEPGDCVEVAIPIGAPLDGGGPIVAGAHTLQLRLYTDEGFEVVSTGITVGQATPTRIPAGEGSVPLGAGVFVLLGAAGAALVAGRRLVTAG